MSILFPKWTNHLPTIGAVVGAGFVTTVVGAVWYYFTPKFWEVGYMPKQPGGGFSHVIHAGKLGMDCRYCHSNVEKAPEANLPNVAVCYGCHAEGHVKYEFAPEQATKFIRDAHNDASVEGGKSIEWRRIHKLPDYVRNFPHHIHVKAGVSCYSCHNMIPRMEVVHQAESLSMGWCLDCHRNPTPHLVPPDKVTDLFWVAEQLKNKQNPVGPETKGGQALLSDLKAKVLHHLPENCGACHY